MGKIMIVDDEEGIRRVLAMRLGSEDYEIVTHGDAVEALEAIDREHPDLVLMDINMPRMDGYEACRRLTTRHPELPVLFSRPVPMSPTVSWVSRQAAAIISPSRSRRRS